MLQMNREDAPRPKCLFTSSILPAHIDRDQIPNKKRPFCSIASQSSYHTLDVLLPESRTEDFKQVVLSNPIKLQYARVYMKLADLIKGDFFNQYIKTGNILMLSEGRPAIDRVFSLREGILRLEVDKPTYERLGLQGSVMASEGRKHIKARYAIELNLRLPSMVRGHKGFERLVRACDNVLNESLAWLFYDLQGPNDGKGPITAFQPQVKSLEPETQLLGGVIVPEFPQEFNERDHEEAANILEWITMALHSSPRLSLHDSMDSYLSRYSVPSGPSASAPKDGQNLVKFQWHGFMPSTFVSTTLIELVKLSREDWFAMSATSFEGSSCTIFQNGHDTATWEYAD